MAAQGAPEPDRPDRPRPADPVERDGARAVDGAAVPDLAPLPDGDRPDEVGARRGRRVPAAEASYRARYDAGYDPALERLAALRTLYPRAYAHLDPRLREACEEYTRTRRRPWLPQPDPGTRAAVIGLPADDDAARARRLRARRRRNP